MCECVRERERVNDWWFWLLCWIIQWQNNCNGRLSKPITLAHCFWHTHQHTHGLHNDPHWLWKYYMTRCSIDCVGKGQKMKEVVEWNKGKGEMGSEVKSGEEGSGGGWWSVLNRWWWVRTNPFCTRGHQREAIKSPANRFPKYSSS